MDPLVILIDVDHTLLDGDAVRAAISADLEEDFGAGAASAFWVTYEAVRAELGNVDVIEIANRLEAERGFDRYLVGVVYEHADFTECFHTGAREALAHLAQLGLTVVLSDGPTDFQFTKILHSGIDAAVEGRVLIVPHKERALGLVTTMYPAAHYALLDDRASILGAVKARLGERVTTVHVRQGRYIDEPSAPGSPPPDLELPSIEAALDLDERALLGGAGDPSRA